MTSPGDYRPTDAYITFTQDIPRPDATSVDELSWTGVMRAVGKGPQIHAKPRTRIPAWSVAAIAWGVVLIALGLCLNQPVSVLIWEAFR